MRGAAACPCAASRPRRQTKSPPSRHRRPQPRRVRLPTWLRRAPRPPPRVPQRLLLRFRRPPARRRGDAVERRHGVGARESELAAAETPAAPAAAPRAVTESPPSPPAAARAPVPPPASPLRFDEASDDDAAPVAPRDASDNGGGAAAEQDASDEDSVVFLGSNAAAPAPAPPQRAAAAGARAGTAPAARRRPAMRARQASDGALPPVRRLLALRGVARHARFRPFTCGRGRAAAPVPRDRGAAAARVVAKAEECVVCMHGNHHVDGDDHRTKAPVDGRGVLISTQRMDNVGSRGPEPVRPPRLRGEEARRVSDVPKKDGRVPRRRGVHAGRVAGRPGHRGGGARRGRARPRPRRRRRRGAQSRAQRPRARAVGASSSRAAGQEAGVAARLIRPGGRPGCPLRNLPCLADGVHVCSAPAPARRLALTASRARRRGDRAEASARLRRRVVDERRAARRLWATAAGRGVAHADAPAHELRQVRLDVVEAGSRGFRGGGLLLYLRQVLGTGGGAVSGETRVWPTTRTERR